MSEEESRGNNEASNEAHNEEVLFCVLSMTTPNHPTQKLCT